MVEDAIIDAVSVWEVVIERDWDSEVVPVVVIVAVALAE